MSSTFVAELRMIEARTPSDISFGWVEEDSRSCPSCSSKGDDTEARAVAVRRMEAVLPSGDSGGLLGPGRRDE